jgi:PhnB protein
MRKMTVESYLYFNGNCREAVEFYTKVFDTQTPEFMTFAELPADSGMEISEENKDLIMHVGIEIEGSIVMFSDATPDNPVTMGDNVTLVVSSNDTNKLQNYFNQMKEEGNVEMELQETFWSKLYGMVTDKFGVLWQFNHYDENEKESMK